MAYATRHACTLFHISPETARTWAEEFARHLSPLANPGTGRHRQYTDDDMKVLALVADMKRNNMLFADIHASLESGQRGASPALEASDIQALVITERENQMLGQVQKLQERMGELQTRINELLPFRDENIRLKARLEIVETTTAKRVDELTIELQKAQSEIKQLNREIGRLEVNRE